MWLWRVDRRERSHLNYNSILPHRRRRGCWIKSSVTRQCDVSGAERHLTREAKPTELVKDCNDGGGGGKICDEAEGEGAVDVNDGGIVDIDGGGIHSSSNLQNFGVDLAVLVTF